LICTRPAVVRGRLSPGSGLLDRLAAKASGVIMSYTNRTAPCSRKRLAKTIGPVVGLLFCFSGLLRAQEGRAPALPEGDGKQLVAAVCSQCHGLRQTQILRDGQNGCEETVNRMVLSGAQLTPAQADTITHYLAVQLGPGTDPMSTGPLPGNNTKEISLPVGRGRNLCKRAACCVTTWEESRVPHAARQTGKPLPTTWWSGASRPHPRIFRARSLISRHNLASSGTTPTCARVNPRQPRDGRPETVPHSSD